MKFTNKWLGTHNINTQKDLDNLYFNFNGRTVEDYRFAEDKKQECPEGYKFLFQLKFTDEDGFWTVGYTDINSLYI